MLLGTLDAYGREDDAPRSAAAPWRWWNRLGAMIAVLAIAFTVT